MSCEEINVFLLIFVRSLSLSLSLSRFSPSLYIYIYIFSLISYLSLCFHVEYYFLLILSLSGRHQGPDGEARPGRRARLEGEGKC